MEAAGDVSVWALLTEYVVRFPLFLVWGVAVVAALTRYRRLPRQAAATVAAAIILTLDTLVGTYLGQRLVVWMLSRGGADDYTIAHLVLTFLRAAVQAVAWVLLSWAALGRIVRPFEKG